jgi:hypothetical protein
MSESNTSGNQVSTTQRAAILEAYNALLTAVSGLGYDLSVLSRVQDGVTLTTPVLTPINAVVMDSDIDSQRRRLTGRGR